MTRFTIISTKTGKELVQLTGTVQDVKRYLNPAKPSAASVNHTLAKDGRGNIFRLEREEVKE
jgi:hypothetical protein